MSRLAIVCCVLMAIAVTVLAHDEEKYPDKWDNINLDEILSNDRLLNNYKECLLDSDEKKCSEDGKVLKTVLAEALHNDCAKCTEKQKKGAQKAIKYLYLNKPDVWKEISGKYDPKNEYINMHPELTKA